ncbi:hypothetical protein [Methylocucumis oryzae]|uniref:hypothetical protein n=1 Tax=Methylocucumis oryzae TaxID=1632867 RepID=UPI001EF9E8DA|nr:hypothetical protein [Methylocucumis oryzae]
MKYRGLASFWLLVFVLINGAVSADEANTDAANPQQEPTVFDVLELQVDGNTLLPQDIVEKSFICVFRRSKAGRGCRTSSLKA